MKGCPGARLGHWRCVISSGWDFTCLFMSSGYARSVRVLSHVTTSARSLSVNQVARNKAKRKTDITLPHPVYEWQTDAKFKISAPNYHWGTKPEKWPMTSLKVIDLWWPRLTSERSQCQSKHGCHLPTPIHVLSISQAKMPKFAISGVEMVGTERKFRLTWLWKSSRSSKVIVVTDLKFSGKM